jgi:hypothetical protein
MSLFVSFVPSWFAVDPPQLTLPTLVKAAAVLALALFVRYAHKPWPATVVLALLLLYFDYAAHRTPVHLLLHALIYLAVGGALFWALDRSTHLVVTIGLALSGIAVVLYLL